MPLRIVRNDITRMQCDAIVNTANRRATVGSGCDYAIYTAAGWDQLLAYRKEKIGIVAEGDVFITPAFNLKAKYIIHAVSPLYIDGNSGEEELLRSCYQKSLSLACENGVESIAFPVIATGGFGYPLEDGMRIAVDEIRAFLENHSMLVYLVVFGTKAAELGRDICPDLESYIDQNYVIQKRDEEYGKGWTSNERRQVTLGAVRPREAPESALPQETPESALPQAILGSVLPEVAEFDDRHESKLKERMQHLSDTFSEYLLYLIADKGLTNAEVYKKAIVDKKVFSKIKSNPYYHPQKITAMCLCVGAGLNLDETKDLLARAGYALSPCDKTDVIFSYFIENKIYDMIELDIQLEEHGEKCLIP